jgi:hypothetical protein
VNWILVRGGQLVNAKSVAVRKIGTRDVEKYPEAQRLMTHPGVGPLTALAFVLIIGERIVFKSGTHQETRERVEPLTLRALATFAIFRPRQPQMARGLLATLESPGYGMTLIRIRKILR